MHYEIWDSETGNIVDTFATKSEALQLVRHAIQDHGVEYVRSWLLGGEDDAESSHLVGEGDNLVQSAMSPART